MTLPRNFLPLTVLLVLLALLGQAEEITGKVVGVHDGDTLTLLTPQQTQLKIRLEGIDAPEMKQPFGNASKQSLSDLVFGKQVWLEVAGLDRYQRTLAHVYAGECWVNFAQIEKGFAWHYKKYSKDARMAEAEIRAIQARVGLWKDPAPVEPWNWLINSKKKAG